MNPWREYTDLGKCTHSTSPSISSFLVALAASILSQPGLLPWTVDGYWEWCSSQLQVLKLLFLSLSRGEGAALQRTSFTAHLQSYSNKHGFSIPFFFAEAPGTVLFSADMLSASHMPGTVNDVRPVLLPFSAGKQPSGRLLQQVLDHPSQFMSP
ncbi:hypothetical protein P7K49_036324 [Saguinus oedipus]|uniref:Uncharacterized protein n=1 Tax=Saguinus oedipus TaxID=9490 RepID=A0ABQ9TJT3_SAGOE|nr:hypothetical protein P7K49_036324 [Saguinus oedipus]